MWKCFQARWRKEGRGLDRFRRKLGCGRGGPATGADPRSEFADSLTDAASHDDEEGEEATWVALWHREDLFRLDEEHERNQGTDDQTDHGAGLTGTSHVWTPRWGYPGGSEIIVENSRVARRDQRPVAATVFSPKNPVVGFPGF